MIAALLTFLAIVPHDSFALLELGLGALSFGSVVYGVWPPGGRPPTPPQAFGRLKGQLGVTGAGVVSAGSDIFNNFTSVTHTGVGDYLVRPSFDVLQSDCAIVEPQTTIAMTGVVIDAAANTIQVLTADAAGAPQDHAFRLSVFG